MIRSNKFFLIFFFLVKLCHAGPFFDGTSSLVYSSVHKVFHAAGGARSKAQGFVRLGNGFTILPDASSIFDMFVTVSGPIDLRETGTLILASDLKLEAGTTFSSGGIIDGGGFALKCGGNLTLPNNKIFHVYSNTIIDGQGHTLTVGDYGQLFVDNSVTLTLQNMVLKSGTKTSVFPPIRCAGSGSQLVLDNVVLVPQSDVPFYQGKLLINNDVVFSGTSALIYNSPQPCFIASGATLLFDRGTTFSYAPATTSKDLIQLQDGSARIVFDGCNVKCTDTGLRLTKGMLLCDNKVSLDSDSSSYLSSLTTGSVWVYYGYTQGYGLIASAWRPDGKYYAIGADMFNGATYGPSVLKILSFDGTNLSLAARVVYGSADGDRLFCMAWSPDGQYIAIGGQNVGIKIYSFNGTALTLAASRSFGSYIYNYAWSVDGRYLAVVGQYTTDAGFGSGSTDEIKVFKFNGQMLTPHTSMPYGNRVIAASWHPSNNYLAIGGFPPGNSGKFGDGNTDELRLYGFDQTMTLTPLVHKPYATTNYINTIQWSPDGNNLVLGGYSPDIADSPINSGDDVRLYGFNGTALTPIASTTYGYSASLNWNPDGKTISVCGQNQPGYLLKTYQFKGSSLVAGASLDIFSGAWAFTCPWHHSGKYLGVGGSGPGAIGAAGATKFYVINTSFTNSANTQALSNSIIFGNSAIGSSSNLSVKILSGALVDVRGQVLDDSV